MADNLDAVVSQLWHEGCHTYAFMCSHIQTEYGIRITPRQLGYRLKKLGLCRTNRTPINEVRDIIKAHQRRSAELLGYRNLWKKMRLDGINVSRTVVQRIVSEINPRGIYDRQRRRFRRGNYYSLGPNYTWYIDGNDKLQHYGLYIHGCIDGFSRRLIWEEIGYTNKDPAITAYFFLRAVEEMESVPRKVRVDRGTENDTIGQIQNFLSQNMHGTLFGKSIRNQRIEQYWGILRHTWTKWWQNHFALLERNGHYECSPFDKSLIRFCYLDVLRAELRRNLIEWNCHRVRFNAGTQLPQGVPNWLFEHPETYGYADQRVNYEQDMLNDCRPLTREPSFLGDDDTEQLLRFAVTNEEYPYPPRSARECRELYIFLRARVLP